jgi:hypothetical protein
VFCSCRGSRSTSCGTFPCMLPVYSQWPQLASIETETGSPNMEPNRRSSSCRGLDPPLCSDKSLLDPSASGGYNMDSHGGIKWVDKPKTIYERIGSFMLFNSYTVFPKYVCEYHSSTVQKPQYCNIA